MNTIYYFEVIKILCIKAEIFNKYQFKYKLLHINNKYICTWAPKTFHKHYKYTSIHMTFEINVCKYFTCNFF